MGSVALRTRACAIRLLVAAAALAIAACGGAGAPGAGAPPVTSEADAILHMDKLRAAGFRGAGVRVGVISTGVAYLTSYQQAGVLPASIYLSHGVPGSLDEGSWMLELVHQHAPDAVLGFCDGRDLDFYGCIKDLATNFQADVIVDDILFSGQFYPDATADTVTALEAANPRLVFIHLAGNEQSGGYWRGPFAAIQGSVGGVMRTTLDFGAASGGASDPYNSVSLPAGKHLKLIVNWNDPPHGAANHALSAYLLDDSLQPLAVASDQANPTLVVEYTNPSGAAQMVHLAVTLDAGSATDGLSVQITEGSATCNIECQALGHSSSGLAGGSVGDFPDALVVGSTVVTSPMQLDPWTNYGPFRLDFQSIPDAAAADGYDYLRLPTPIEINKPDLVAPDCVTVPFSNGTSLVNNQFCGTSSAVVAVAGAVALLESAGFDRVQVLKALRGTAAPLGAAAWDPGYGFGLANAEAAYHSGGQ